MYIEYGNTRVVFLFSLIVVKIPRTRFGDAFRTLIDYLHGRSVGIAGDKFAGKPVMTILAYLFSGITSNRREYAFSRKHPPPDKVTPSCNLLLGGLIHVQRRGRKLTESDPRWVMFTSLLRERGVDNLDLYNIDNFSEYPGTSVVCIHDCGWRLSVRMLDDFALKFLDMANEHRHETVRVAASV